MKKKFALVAHACDNYAFLFKGFTYLFEKYWPVNENVEAYFLTEKADFNHSLFKNIKTGEGEWSDRLHRALQEIEEEYIIYLQEDFWFQSALNRELWQNILDYFLQAKPDILKLHGCHDYHIKGTGEFIGPLEIGQLSLSESNFLMSHQISIWNKGFFLKQLPSGEHPWRNERNGSQRIKKLSSAKIIHLDLFQNNDHPQHNNNNDFRPCIYNTVSDRSMMNDFTPRYFSDFRNSDSGDIVEYGKVVEEHYKLGLTHKGNLPQARWQKKLSQLFNFFK